MDSDCSAQKNDVKKRDDDEAAITDLLSRHCSIQDQCEKSFISLRLLLLKEPSKRQSNDTSAIEMIKASFRDYLKSSKEDGQIATLLVQEWDFIKREQTSTSCHGPFLQHSQHENPQLQSLSENKDSPAPLSLLHTNYASQ